MNININQRQKLALLAVFLIGAAAGAFVFYRLNSEIFSAKSTFLAEFEKKFQEKKQNNSFPLVTSSDESGQTENFLSGAIERNEPAKQSFFVGVKNIYRSGSIVDFVVNQPDFFEIKILADEKTRFVSFGLDTVSSAAPLAVDKNINQKDLKEGQSVMIVLRQGIDLSKTQIAFADLVRVMFGSQPPPGK